MDSQKNAYFTRNVGSVSAAEFFWGLGFPVVLESTFLQLYLRSLGASSFAISIVPSLLIFGISFFPLFSSYFSRNMRFKRSLVLILHLITSLSILIFGSVLFFLNDPGNILPLFFAFYTVFSICIGLTIPLWLNYLVRIFSEGKIVPGLGYIMLAQNIAKFISSFFLLKIVDKYSFSQGSSACLFILTGLLFVIGSFCYIFTKEVADPNDPEPDNLTFFNHTRKSFSDILRNRRFLVFLAADLDFYVIITVLSFYANYATEFFAVPVAVAAGLFVACIYAGSITVNVFLGTMDILGLKQKFILSKCITFMLLIFLTFLPGHGMFFLISYMLGSVRAIRNMVYSPSVKKLSGKTDATPYFALAPILTIPVAVGFPLVFGKMLDYLSFMHEDAYRILFGCSAIFILLTLYFSFRTDYSGQVKVSPENAG